MDAPPLDPRASILGHPGLGRVAGSGSAVAGMALAAGEGVDDRATSRHFGAFSGGMADQLGPMLGQQTSMTAGEQREAAGEGGRTSVVVESSGDIEVLCRQRSAALGGAIQLFFQAYEDPKAPFCVKVRAPSGKVILERVLRDLPTGKPQSAAPLELVATAGGDYRVEIKELYGSGRGEAVLRVRV